MGDFMEKVTDFELEQRFFQAPSNKLEEMQKQLRMKGLEFAKFVRDLTPASPEQTLAIDTIDRATMLAIKAIAMNVVEP